MKHEESVESLVLSADENILFSGARDNKVIVWCMATYAPLAELDCEFKIDTLQLNLSQQFLMATSRFEQRAFWKVEENLDAIRLNFGLGGLTECYVTPNDEYLLNTND